MNITGRTQIVGVIGDPIAHSRSPAMHNAAFAELGMDWVYVPFCVRRQDLREAVRGFRAIGVRGINATIPHKEALVSAVDELSDEAAFVGAVNTLAFCRDGRIRGDNTDSRGFLAGLGDAGIPLPVGRRAVVLGAGGAARAVTAALGGAQVGELVIANRTLAKAEALAAEIRTRLPVSARAITLDHDALAAVLPDAALLVNATSAGMEGHDPLRLDGSLLGPHVAVYDIIYAPSETPLLRTAARRGCQTANGVGMLVHQGAVAFETWSGISPPVDVMRQALLASL